jgi:hypothetical protein
MFAVTAYFCLLTFLRRVWKFRFNIIIPSTRLDLTDDVWHAKCCVCFTCAYMSTVRMLTCRTVTTFCFCVWAVCAHNPAGKTNGRPELNPYLQSCVIIMVTIRDFNAAVRTSETSVDNHFTRQYIPEDNSELHTRRHPPAGQGLQRTACYQGNRQAPCVDEAHFADTVACCFCLLESSWPRRYRHEQSKHRAARTAGVKQHLQRCVISNWALAMTSPRHVVEHLLSELRIAKTELILVVMWAVSPCGRIQIDRRFKWLLPPPSGRSF